MKIHIPSELYRRISEQAERDYPDETCGLLLGSRSGKFWRVERIVPAENTHPNDRRHRYEVDRATYEKAEAAATEAGLTVIGAFHSHPDAEAWPSQVDAEFAFPGWVYWIVSVIGRRAVPAEAWLREEQAEAWTGLEIVKE